MMYQYPECHDDNDDDEKVLTELNILLSFSDQLDRHLNRFPGKQRGTSIKHSVAYRFGELYE
jgi:hypothetical protein